jgi:alpha/beta superfamily hydrolase
VLKIEKFSVRGLAGDIQAIGEFPVDTEPTAIALLCHPHPLHGSMMENKVVHTLARSFLCLSWAAVRFNFRGVGDSEGTYGDGLGATEDAIAKWMRTKWPGSRFFLGGFSFSAAVALLARRTLQSEGLVTVAPPPARAPPVFTQPSCPWLVVQGNEDEVADPDEIVEWLNSLEPGPELRIFDGAEHFFHGKLIELRDSVIEFFQLEFAVEQPPRGS